MCSTALAIETRKLYKTYGPRKVVDGLSLHVPKGCVYGFIGPNGAGKSTTMKMLLGLVRPTSGMVQLLDIPFVAHLALYAYGTFLASFRIE